MTTTELADILQRQLSRHGYHVTDAEARDVAANLIMCMEGEDCMCSSEGQCDYHWRRDNTTDTSGTWSPAQATQRTT